eukprot:tig00000317_g24026.t1
MTSFAAPLAVSVKSAEPVRPAASLRPKISAITDKSFFGRNFAVKQSQFTHAADAKILVSASVSGNGTSGSGRAPIPESEVDLSVTVNGLKMPNPFVIASGPPGTNANVISKAFDEGWGAVIAKTVCLDASKIINVTPRYAKMRSNSNFEEIIGWQNIELISDRPLDLWLKEFRELKQKYPDRILIASVMEEFNKSSWQEIIHKCQEAGVDAFEINFSCPHGMPERKMGAAMGQDPELLHEVCGWISEASSIPVWAKMTPNITDITVPARQALSAGVEGVSAINTIMSVMGINLDSLRPEPIVEGKSTPGGYSGKAVRPIALRMNMQLASLIRDEFPGKTLSGMGGVETGEDAAQFLLIGANTVQVCTGVMLHGYGMVKDLESGLRAFMARHGFRTVEEFRGLSLPYFTSHHELVDLKAAAKEKKKAAVASDKDWDGDKFTEQSSALASN